jgi:RHS repeat-associated protein
VKNRLSRFVENETQRQRNGYEFESGLRYLKEDIRFTKQAPMFETVKQRSLYSDAGEQLLAEEDTYGDHKITRGFVYFGNQRVAVVERREAAQRDAQSASLEGSRGSSPEEALSEKNNKSSIFPKGKDRWTSYIRDHQGSLLMSITDYEAPATDWGITDPRYLDAAGKSRLETTAKIGANQYYVYPYGVLQHKGFLYSQLQGTEYTGKNLDEGTQWYYFHARHYDSLYGRFISHDLVAPDLSNPLTLNPFLYCLNNPGRWVDPDGRAPILVPLVIAATAVIMNPVPMETEGGRWQATKGMVVDIAAGVVGEQAIAAIGGKLAGLWAGRASKVVDNNVAVRTFYLKQIEAIPSKIDMSLPIRDKAISAFQLRNVAKFEAREMMTDRKLATLLDRTDPVPSFRDMVRKTYDGGLGSVGDDLWQSIFDSSMRSRSSVNDALGLGK